MLTTVEAYIDPSCPWAWVTSRWLKQVAPHRDLDLAWRPYCLEIRDDYGVASTVSDDRRDLVIAAHAVSHRMLRIMEAARVDSDVDVFDPLLTAWGPRFFTRDRAEDGELLSQCLAVCGLDVNLLAAADDEKWDVPIVEAMQVAYEFGGPKTQTPTLVVRAGTPHGFKGPVMSMVPSAEDGLKLWDALMVLSENDAVYEFTRPRRDRPHTEQG